MEKQYLKEKLDEWIHINGKLPKKDDMKRIEGFPPSYQYFKELGLKRWNEVLVYFGYNPTLRLWTTDEINYIKENWLSHTDGDIGKVLKRSKDAVRYKRLELELFRKSTKQSWQKWENDFLINNFYDAEQSVIEATLPHRKWETIRAYATKQLELKRKNHLHKYQTGDGNRICDMCEGVFPENTQYFYKDGNGYRTKCINCYNIYQEQKARENGVLTRKLKQEKFEDGLSKCSCCGEWKPIDSFQMITNELRSIRRYCRKCDKFYLWEYNLKRRYGEDYKLAYEASIEKVTDNQGIVWDSKDEVFISNWFFKNGFQVSKGKNYKDVFKDDLSKRRFDFTIKKDSKVWCVEYFGLWNVRTWYGKHYTKKAKKKIKLLYKYRHDFNFIILFERNLLNLEKAINDGYLK
ncbi:hypothetical protein [Lysinibacillus sp. LZ02]|uniref:hypothetical protein n=1 Tax=Lysinibacillus sp. LZ02 TaxID=3420668 RepID=UPI003D36BE25